METRNGEVMGGGQGYGDGRWGGVYGGGGRGFGMERGGDVPHNKKSDRINTCGRIKETVKRTILHNATLEFQCNTIFIMWEVICNYQFSQPPNRPCVNNFQWLLTLACFCTWLPSLPFYLHCSICSNVFVCASTL